MRAMSLAAGVRLNAFEILTPIGAGGMGEVYRAYDSKLKRDVAIKILPEALARDPERVSRFEREAELLASLNHSNIAVVHDFQQSGDRHFPRNLYREQGPDQRESAGVHEGLKVRLCSCRGGGRCCSPW